MTGAYAFGHISGGHFNPAVFWVAPVIGALLAGVVHSYVILERAETVEGH